MNGISISDPAKEKEIGAEINKGLKDKCFFSPKESELRKTTIKEN